ncbi:MAG TPA: 4'-phosphopantetheinyl transferase superfamily protein [Desulfohalobiaceae bacterium]|nr:4'-phosphopantetheinyl transferase superfamily protein [Desulfohalobiaceae bacterium]
MDNPVVITVRICKIPENREAKELLLRLPLAAREKSTSFRKESSKVNYAAARLLLVEALGEEPSVISRLEKNEQGKPFILGYPEFSLTHTEGFVAVAVAEKGRLGIDVEKIRDIRLDDFDSYLTQKEKKEIDGSCERFFYLWTAKEAAMKAAGTGLKEPISAAFVNSNSVSYEGVRWSLKTMNLFNFRVSICSDYHFIVDFAEINLFR